MRKTSEFTLIQQAFRAHAPSPHPLTCIANGDDASVHRLDQGMDLVISTDSSLEGSHWPKSFPLHLAADRAVCAALSDLAAMGAEPLWVWVAVLTDSRESFCEFGKGVNQALNRYQIELAGGDTVSSPCNGLTVTVGGQLPRGSAMCRHTAHIDDKIWLIGSVGEASLGLQQWLTNNPKGAFAQTWAEVTPQLQAGLNIRRAGVRCCIDISDGLIQDATHIAKASNVGMHIELEHLKGWKKRCQEVGKEHFTHAVIGGGEDYALLFTAPAHIKGLESWATHIGQCNASKKVVVTAANTEVTLGKAGFDHFTTKEAQNKP
ncbi:MAG: thiamine-phosphate kinase [Mariprofundaceae bacterium]